MEDKTKETKVRYQGEDKVGYKRLKEDEEILKVSDEILEILKDKEEIELEYLKAEEEFKNTGCAVEHYKNRIKGKVKGKGKIYVSKSILKVIARHDRLVKKMSKETVEYVYSKDYANWVIAVAENILGFRLYDYQRFILALIYGVMYKPQGYVHGAEYSLKDMLSWGRVTTEVVLTMSRKNGKTFIANVILLLNNLLSVSKKMERKSTIIAGSQTQSDDCLTQIQEILNKTKAFSADNRVDKLYMVKKQSIEFYHPHIPGVHWSVTSRAPTLDKLDGLRSETTLLDEYSQWRDANIINRMQSGQGDTESPMMIYASTSNISLDCDMYNRLLPMCKSKLDSKDDADMYILPIIYEQDDDTEVDKPWLWIKSNPSLEVDSEYLDALRRGAKKPKARKGRFLTNLLKSYKSSVDGDMLSYFKVKNLNYWLALNMASIYAKPEDYTNNIIGDRSKFYGKVERLRGHEYTLGLDYSQKSDLTSVSVVVDNYREEELLIDSYSFVPFYGYTSLEERSVRDKIAYDEYEKIGHCSRATGVQGMIDMTQVYNFILDLKGMLDDYGLKFRGLHVDRYLAGEIVTALERKGIELIEVVQTNIGLSDTIKYYRSKVIEGRIKFSDNELMKRANLHSSLYYDIKGNLCVEKVRNNSKIDSLDATINAMEYFAKVRRLEDEKSREEFAKAYRSGAIKINY